MSSIIHLQANSRTISFELKNKVTEVPKCHDKHELILTKHVSGLNALPHSIDIIRIVNDGVPQLLNKSQKFDCVYTSTKVEKLEILQNLTASYMDRFYERAPNSNDPEVAICEKIKELEQLIQKLDKEF